MTCATCRRLRERAAAELARIKAFLAGPTSAELAAAERRRRIAERASKTGGTAPVGRSPGTAKASHLRLVGRRDVIRAGLAGVAIATGLARAQLELVDDAPKPLTFKGVELVWDGEELLAAERRALERAWTAVNTGGGKPDYVWIRDDQLEDVWRYWNA